MQVRNLIGEVCKEKNIDEAAAAAAVFEEVKHEVECLVALRQQRQNEIKRLRLAVSNLDKTQSFLQEQLGSYEQYLNSARDQNLKAQASSKKKKVKGVKFSYASLVKQGVVVDTALPEKQLKVSDHPIESLNES